MRRRFAASLGALVVLGCAAPEPPLPPPDGRAPYPRSRVLGPLAPDWSRYVTLAPGSDNWPVTWAADDAQYTSFGDGGGFGGTNEEGRASLGVARLDGDYDGFEGTNLWGGVGGTAPAFDGKSYGILAAGDVLWMWVGPGSGTESYKEARLARSTDRGATWERMRWSFPERTRLAMPTFLQYGRDRAGAPDDFAYTYFIRREDRADTLAVHRPGAVDLARAPIDRLGERDAWEFFAGDATAPAWTTDADARVPVFEDPNGVGWCVSAVHLPHPDRIVLCTEHAASFTSNLGMFEAPAPWGPWSTVEYGERWGEPHVPAKAFFWTFAPKWSTGEEVVLVFTGIEELDAWCSVPAVFGAPSAP